MHRWPRGSRLNRRHLAQTIAVSRNGYCPQFGVSLRIEFVEDGGLGMREISAAVVFAALAASTGTAFAEPFWLYDRNATTPMVPGRPYVGFIASGGVQQ